MRPPSDRRTRATPESLMVFLVMDMVQCDRDENMMIHFLIDLLICIPDIRIRPPRQTTKHHLTA